MLFSSIPFLNWFLPIMLICYFIAPKKLKNSVILLFSLAFYGWGEPRYVVIMVFSIVVGYLLGLLIEKFRGKMAAKWLVALSVIFSAAMLGYFKYADFFITNFNAVTGMSLPLLKVALPIGISFYTFQLLSYTIDVYRGANAQHSIIKLATYIAMFPQLIAGPIVRYTDIEGDLLERKHTFEKTALGIRRFIIGLSKKVLLANTLYELCTAFNASSDKSVLFYWLYAIAFTLHIYFDFSGYSDMAIGLGHMLGFTFMENFNYPYISSSVTEFWRRWHISLGSWFRDYVYIPLGGNRVKKWKQIRNILAVWLLTGMWHGAEWTFILWGLWYGILLLAEKNFLAKYLKRTRVIKYVYTLLFVVLGFVLFNAPTAGEAFSQMGAMFGLSGIPAVSKEALYVVRDYGLIFIAAIIGATPLPKKLAEKCSGKILNVLEIAVLMILLILCIAFLVDGSFNPFLYFRF